MPRVKPNNFDPLAADRTTVPDGDYALRVVGGVVVGFTPGGGGGGGGGTRWEVLVASDGSGAALVGSNGDWLYGEAP